MEEDQRIEKLERLLEISRNLSATRELEPLLQSIIEDGAELTGSQASSILLYVEENEQLKFAAAPINQLETLKALTVPIEKSIAGRVFKDAQPMIVKDTHSDDRVYRKADQELNFVTRNILAVPLIFRGETIGVLEAINKIGDLEYTQEDLKTLETLASHAAIAIQNARMLAGIQRAYDELEELDRLKTDFIAIASHELRTPLGVVLGHATFLEAILTEENYKQQLKAIIKNASRLKDLIADLSSIDNFQTGKASVRRKPVSIPELVGKIVAGYQDDAKNQGKSLDIKLPEGDLVIQAEPDKISIALHNLLNNALAFTPEGGHITVQVEEHTEHVVVSVIDDGIGIPENAIKRVFDRFYQVEGHLTRRHAGMGLGLSVTKAMIELHGGEIWVESKENQGSNFTFTLPKNPTN
jgi:signal transduction histidine kinase